MLANGEALKYTQMLLDAMKEMEVTYEDVKQTKKEHDFTEVVEPYARKIEELTEKWQKLMKEEIQSHSGYFTGERQVDQVVDNLSHLSVQAFYASTSYNRFKSYMQSTKFLLKTMERQLKE